MGDQISSEAADAMERLFRAEAAGLFGYARTLPGVSRSDAEDLVQVTFQAAAVEWERRLRRLDEESRRGWLYRVLRNKAIDQWRGGTSRRLQAGAEAAEEAPAPLRETDHDALCSITLQRCWDRIGSMPAMRQRVAFLKWGEDWASRDIADLLGITQSTVRVHLKLARDELAKEIGPEVPFTVSGDEVDTEVTL
jgi:RNA polymerase sigma factor (sigma-70 family)